jgi:hypothetical protein
MIEHWNGTSWAIVASPTTSGLLRGVAGVSANNIWAVGGVVEHWDGMSWSIVSGPSVDYNAVTALSDGTVIAVGRSCSTSCSAAIVEN